MEVGDRWALAVHRMCTSAHAWRQRSYHMSVHMPPHLSRYQQGMGKVDIRYTVAVHHADGSVSVPHVIPPHAHASMSANSTGILSTQRLKSRAESVSETLSRRLLPPGAFGCTLSKGVLAAATSDVLEEVSDNSARMSGSTPSSSSSVSVLDSWLWLPSPLESSSESS